MNPPCTTVACSHSITRRLSRKLALFTMLVIGALEGDATLPVDESLFKRALSNLLGNATRFARRDSTLLIRIGAQSEAGAGIGEHVRVVVQNEGEAIDAVALPRLFDRFFRGHASRHSDDTQHHGLGMAIVAAIARMHGGARWRDRLAA